MSLLLSGCVQQKALTENALISSGGGGGSGSGSAPSESGLLYLKMTTEWDDLPGVELDVGTCRVTAPATTATCTLTVPEAQLYFSKLKIRTGTNDTTNCKVLVFYPFWYRASTAAGFVPGWDPDASAVDCTEDVADCYNGPAKEIISDFPTVKGLYVATDSSQEMTEEVTSANSNGQPNRWTSNGLDDRTVAVAGWFLGGAANWQDYVAECRDEWFQLKYRATVVLKDEDTNAGDNPGDPTDDAFSDWND